MYTHAIRMLLLGYSLTLKLVCSWRRFPGNLARRARTEGCVIVATGTFFSSNWLESHLAPILRSPACRELVLAADADLIRDPKLVTATPSRWLRRLFGRVGARMLVFLLQCLRRKPDFVIGYHMVPNGLLALLVARLVGARCIYQCCAGELEFDGGGPAMLENGLLKRVLEPDPVIAGRLRLVIPLLDIIIVRGDRAASFFRRHGAKGPVVVMSAGVDEDHFVPNGSPKEYDLITVGRLAEVKRLDVYLETTRLLVDRGLQPRAVIVGDGPVRSQLEDQARQLGLAEHVVFAGHQDDVAAWLGRSKVFVLTSDTEGLSIALAEAMMAGVPAVVSDVGDLAMLVIDDQNGYLVPRRRSHLFADRIGQLLRDEALRSRFAERARAQALSTCGRQVIIRRWTGVLSGSQAGPQGSAGPS